MPSQSKSDHISVCICTYKRPEMLARALKNVIDQTTESAFTFEIIVVDNDSQRSAEETVRLIQASNTTKIIYDCEPEQSISLARNRAIANATGNLIAFMDDDEFPIRHWLINLYHTMKNYNADGALGPVIPHYPQDAPLWLIETNIFDRRRLQTGTRLTDRDTRTGNTLLSRIIFDSDELPFDPAFGRTGGEDVDFFRKQISSGRYFVWCDEAEVYETVPPERWQNSFHLRKNLRMGTLNGERLRRDGAKSLTELMRTIMAVPVWLSVFLVSLLISKRESVQSLLKLVYACGCLSAFCGLALLRHRG